MTQEPKWLSSVSMRWKLTVSFLFSSLIPILLFKMNVPFLVTLIVGLGCAWMFASYSCWKVLGSVDSLWSTFFLKKLGLLLEEMS